MHSTHLHFLSVCQCPHRPGSVFVNGSAKFMSMTSHSSKSNRDVPDSKLLSAQCGVRPIRSQASSDHQALQLNQHLVCYVTSGLKSRVVTWASQAGRHKKGQTRKSWNHQIYLCLIPALRLFQYHNTRDTSKVCQMPFFI